MTDAVGDGRTPSPTVLAAIRDEEWRSHVRSALGDWSRLAFVSGADDLPVAAADRTPDVVLWHLDQLTEPVEVYTVAFRELRRIAPRSTVIAYGAVGRATAPCLLIAGRVGVDRLLLRGFDDLARGIRETLRSTRVEVVVRDVIVQLGLSRGPAVLTLAHCLRCASMGSTTVQEVARDLGVSRRTICRWLRDCGLPSPEHALGCCRVYWVAHSLAESDRSVARVAQMLRFSSESDLRRMVSRYAGCTPTQLKAMQPSAHVAMLRGRLSPSQAQDHLSYCIASHRSTGSSQ